MERKIVIGLITSTKFIKRIRPYWDSMLIESPTGRMLSGWAIAHFDTYDKAPNTEIESIFYRKLNEGLAKDIANEIEEDILPSLSEEFEDYKNFDLEPLVDDTIKHLQSRQLINLKDQIEGLIEHGKGDIQERIKQADELVTGFKPINKSEDSSIDLSTKEALENVKLAFTKAAKPIIKFPKQLGEFWNDELVPGGFISFLAPEKRGKTFWLLEFAMRAAKQGNTVVFFQAGDMNEAEQLKRIGIYLTKRNSKQKYCKEHFEPIRDCILNQMDKCDRPERQCDYGIFDDMEEDEIRQISMKDLIETFKDNSEFEPCYNCKMYQNSKLGVPWLRYIEPVEPLEHVAAQKAVKEFFHKYKRRFKLSTHANGTLSTKDIEAKLDYWQNRDNFIPDVIIIDYADLLLPSVKTEFRHQQNQIWKDLRRLSQTKRKSILPLVISPTQADAIAYKAYLLGLSNFSEDKRKYGHVTAMYGLNQDPLGREKALKIMRINKIIAREDEFLIGDVITILQNLWQGRPFKESYF